MKRLLVLLITLCPLAFGQQAPVSPNAIMQQVTAAYSSDTAIVERVAAWKPLIDVLAEGNAENKKQIAGFLAQMMSERLKARITTRITDIAILVNFLKTFSKEEAVHILHIWIQANTNPQKVNEIYATPETFMKNKTGDCTEVAWLAETVLKEMDIETTVFVSRYRIDHSFTVFVAGHAFTGLEFTEDNITKRYIIDNTNLYELSLEDTWKDIIWQIYSKKSEVWRYREVDTSLWRNVRGNYDDPQMRAMDMFVIYAPISSREEAAKEFAEYELSEYFDDPAREILFFRDDYRKTILAQKETGAISENEYERLFNLWRKYENNGLRK